MTKFKVGDRVRTVNSGNGFNVHTPDGVEFEVTGVHGWGDRPWYRGDPDDHGIWESRLELAKSAPEVETTTTVNHFWRHGWGTDLGWAFCFDDAEWYLSQGHEVKRVTKTLTTTTEHLEPEDD